MKVIQNLNIKNWEEKEAKKREWLTTVDQAMGLLGPRSDFLLLFLSAEIEHSTVT